MTSDLTGRRFGKLLVIELLNDSNIQSESKYLCSCDCGKNHTALIGNFEKTFSCGCLTTSLSKRTTEISIGDVFGYWVVTGFTKDAKSRQVCICKCKCGIIKNVDSYSLRSGKSTGCISCKMLDVRSKRVSVE